jgi:DNA gyrase/topoisomerase IV subunit A
MATITFDTHVFIKKLTESGLTEQQAEAITELQKETIKTTLEQAKHDHDLNDLVTNKTLDNRIKETELKMELVCSELKRDLAETKSDLIRWLVGVGMLQAALIAALLIKLSAIVP